MNPYLTLTAARRPGPGVPGAGAVWPGPETPGLLGRGSSRGPAGAAAVEFALVLPLFLALLFGVVEFGLILYAKGLITQASREGARYGVVYSLTPKTAADIKAHVYQYLQGAGFADASLDEIYVDGAQGPSGSPLTVKVVYPYQFIALSNLIADLVGPVNLSAETAMRME